MRYDATTYAKALSEATLKSPDKENAIIKNFLNLVAKNGDAAKLKKIADLTEEMTLKKNGGRKITIESARPLPKLPADIIKKISGATDVIESKIEPSLIAGVRITVNKDLEWDGSLAKKLSQLFT